MNMFLHIEFKNGSNPYLAFPKTEKEAEKMIKRWTRNYKVVDERRTSDGDIFLTLTEKQGMWIVDYVDSNDEPYSELCFTRSEISQIIRKGYAISEIIELKVSGHTYAERKASLEELAKQYQSSLAVLSLGEIAEIDWFFRINGKRYGLLTEFRENAIC